MGHSVLVVPVPQLEDFVRARTEHYDSDFLSGDPLFVHAHITALGPFLHHVDNLAAETIAGIVQDIGAFEFTLTEIDTFPNGIIHLVPDPAEPFSELTRRLSEAFPQCPPYGGQFEDLRPHLTLDQRTATITEDSTRELLGDAVPASCRAERVDLAWYEPGRCHLIRSWSLLKRRASRPATGLA
jgi:2'-5' RNA ligase